ncbi:glycosyltransferase family 29 protein [Pseudoscourfieldia marina]
MNTLLLFVCVFLTHQQAFGWQYSSRLNRIREKLAAIKNSTTARLHHLSRESTVARRQPRYGWIAKSEGSLPLSSGDLYMSGSKVFEKLKDVTYGKSVCIVAYNDKLDKLKYGEQIDSYDVVIRMNNHNFEKNYESYGTKRTIEVCNFWTFPKIASSTELVMTSHPLDALRGGEPWKTNFKKSIELTKIPHYETDKKLFDMLYNTLKSFPSTGCVVLMTVFPHIKDMECFHVYGMDGYKSNGYNSINILKNHKDHHNMMVEQYFLQNHFYNKNTDKIQIK